MALHNIIEKHKVSILGQEITYTNKFIKHTESTSYGFKPSSSLISYSSNIHKYVFEHPYLNPTLFIGSNGDKYIVPSWQKVHPKTTLDDIITVRPSIKKETPIEKNTWKFESSSDPGHFYTVRQSGLKLICDCSGFWRCRDKSKGCKHCQEVRKQLNK
jgi:hypothetical protein